MKIICNKCGFEGNIKDELIPVSGKNVTCPKCKNKFLVQKQVVQPKDSLIQPIKIADQKNKKSISPPSLLVIISFIVISIVCF